MDLRREVVLHRAGVVGVVARDLGEGRATGRALGDLAEPDDARIAEVGGPQDKPVGLGREPTERQPEAGGPGARGEPDVGVAPDHRVHHVPVGVVEGGGRQERRIEALGAERLLDGAPWTRDTVVAAAAALAGEGTPIDDHRASARYRSAMLEQALLKFWAQHAPAPDLEVSR